MNFSSFHTHTVYCDGKNTPEEMILEAIRLGCPAIGFSGHSNTPFDPGYCMDGPREEAYRQEILRLQQAYQGRIAVYLGLEQDYYSPKADPGYQYLIGSAHYVKKDGVYLSVDDRPEILEAGVTSLYGGDYYALCEDYFRLVTQIPGKTGCQILGHFDLIAKFCQKHPLFREDHPRYRAAALSALHALLDQDALLEINTGAMSRGWRTVPYPAPFLLEEMGRCGAKAILTSDAHRKEDLLYGLSDARALCDACHIRIVSYEDP